MVFGTIKNLVYKITQVDKLRISARSKAKLVLEGIFIIGVLVAIVRYNALSHNVVFVDFALKFVIAFIAIDLIIAVIRAAVVSAYRKRNKIPSTVVDNFVLGMNNASILVFFFCLFVYLMYYFKIGAADFLKSFGLVSVAFAWIFKEYLSNIIDGMVIMFGKDFRVDDYIKFDDVKGRIKTIKFLNAEIFTDEGDTIYIPNTTLLSKNVVNYSKVKSKKIMVTFFIPQKKFGNMEAIEKQLCATVKKKFKEYLSQEEPYLHLGTYSKDSVEARFEIPVTVYSFAIEEEIKKVVSTKILSLVK